jgi:hypothetical protein
MEGWDRESAEGYDHHSTPVTRTRKEMLSLAGQKDRDPRGCPSLSSQENPVKTAGDVTPEASSNP